MLLAAKAEIVASGAVDRPLTSAVRLDELLVYEKAGKRAGPLQSMIF